LQRCKVGRWKDVQMRPVAKRAREKRAGVGLHESASSTCSGLVISDRKLCSSTHEQQLGLVVMLCTTLGTSVRVKEGCSSNRVAQYKK